MPVSNHTKTALFSVLHATQRAALANAVCLLSDPDLLYLRIRLRQLQIAGSVLGTPARHPTPTMGTAAMNAHNCVLCS